MIWRYLLCAAAAYLLGSISTGVLVSRALFHDDVRQHGSGGTGATNMLRTYRLKAALLTFAGDAAKAAAAALLGRALAGFGGGCVAAVFVVAGHMWPLFFGFRGGKGILSGVTVALMMDWRIGLFVFGVFLVAYGLTKYVSLGSILSSGAFGPIFAFFHWGEAVFPICVGFGLSALIVWMHRTNIVRLVKGQERKTNLFGMGTNS